MASSRTYNEVMNEESNQVSSPEKTYKGVKMLNQVEEEREKDQKSKDMQKFLEDKEACEIKLSEFHIDDYEQKILNAIPDDNTPVTFNSIVENKSKEEAVRLFAAALQLANMDSVIQISDNNLAADGTQNDSFKLSKKPSTH